MAARSPSPPSITNRYNDNDAPNDTHEHTLEHTMKTLQQQIADDVARLGPLHKGKEQQRTSTMAELTQWLNDLSSGLRTGVTHSYDATTNTIAYAMLSTGGKVIERGTL